MGTALSTTDFLFAGQTGLYHGKVRDVYSIGEDQLLMVATDRISAFDVILPRPVPFKGQVLNQIAAYFLEQTKGIVPNWLRGVPDPNVSAGIKATPFKVEMVIRGALAGHAWRVYDSGQRELSGVTLPEGMKQYDAFPEPIITPSTKADVGHDEDISEADILERKLATVEQWQQMRDYTLKLFAKGQEMAQARGLVLADTKYEFGVYQDQVILIDEVHTPDSSRYLIAGQTGDEPRQLSKEFVREWLMERGFSGQSGQQVPDLPDDFIEQVSARYIELYEYLTGLTFQKSEAADISNRIQTNVEYYLKTEP
jgi:phosphoribosylaminoimidazole-succinocarboxamide synthase